MKYKKRGQKLICVVMLSVAVLIWSGSLLGANMCQIITIENEKGVGGTVVEVKPVKITVPVGTCTVWMNWVAKGDVFVSFRENAKQCMSSSESPTGFNLQDLNSGESCYLSEKLSRGKTASLFWKEPGIFKYTIELKDSPAVSDSLHGSAPLVTGIIEVK